MYIARFRKKYGLELLPTSTGDICLGDLIWKRSHRRPRLAMRGMPSNIYNVFFSSDLLTVEEWEKTMKALESAKPSPAHLGNLEITTNKRFSHSFPHPMTIHINHILHTEHQQKFWFSDLEVRTLTNPWRLDIQERMKRLSPEEKDKYFKRLRPVFIITELFYGTISFSLDKATEHALDPMLDELFDNLVQKIETEKKIQYNFEHGDVPFAMRIEALEEFKG